MDHLSPQQRHKNMAAIRNKNTKPELIVRHGLWKRGFRYRLNHKRLPGHPDLVLRKYRTCIFINGCFWHAHEGCDKYRRPKTNIDFWTAKFQNNKARDERNYQLLHKMGWYVLVVWECQLMNDSRGTLIALSRRLSEIFRETNKAKIYNSTIDDSIPMAAEPMLEYK